MKNEDNNIYPINDTRKSGMWIETDYYITTASGHLDIYKCSACGKDITLDDYDSFCPSCGAKMSGYEFKSEGD